MSDQLLSAPVPLPPAAETGGHQDTRESLADPIAEAARQWRRHGWPEAAPGMAAVTSLMRAQQIMQGRVDAVLRPHGLTFARYEVVMLLVFSRRGALPMRVLGGRLQVHPTSVTNAVDRLEAAGLVRRRAHPADRRVTLVEVTDAGRRRAAAATAELNERVFGEVGMSGCDVETLVAVLGRLRANAGDFPTGASRAPGG